MRWPDKNKDGWGTNMMKDSKILLATIVLCTVALAVFQYVLQMKTLSVSISPTASTIATPKGKVTATPKATVKPTATPEAMVEVTPAE